MAASFTVAPGDRTAYFGLVLDIGDPSPCTRGYEGTDERVPRETSARPANGGAHCAEPITIGSFGGQQRYLGKDSWTWLLIGPLAG
ncbi:MAG TPA: hypothetical protein VF486_13675 [Actinomycetes bacterium]